MDMALILALGIYSSMSVGLTNTQQKHMELKEAFAIQNQERKHV